ncbi:MAG: hypothetical protein M3082_20220 [Candidatus Dormibacteraeota bacterium]|nr:hypothetical protein [Candidatus Dormibacteraeota bacterium]
MALPNVAITPPVRMIRVDPAPSGMTPEVRRRALHALLLLLAIVLVLQPLSVPVAYYSIARLIDVTPEFANMDAHTQWSAYLSRAQAPDVLFVGDSQTFTDVDAGAVARLLSSRVGRPLSVGKLGVPGEGPAFVDALLYRVMKRPSHPRLVVYQIAEWTLNDDRHWDPSADLWQISSPFDPQFMARAYRLDPERGRLVRGWALPYFMTYLPIVTLAQCRLVDGIQVATALLLKHVPSELRGQTSCESGEAYAGRLSHLSDSGSYRFSTTGAANVGESVAEIRAAGAQVVLVEYPVINLEASNSAAYRIFKSHDGVLASNLNVNLVDISSEMSTQTEFWLDAAHFKHQGAVALAPRLADIAAAAFR